MGLLALEMALCTMQKYLYLPKLGKYFSSRETMIRSNYCQYQFELDEAYYLGDKEDVDLVGVLADLSGFLVIFSYIVPISLYSTLGRVYNASC